MLAKYLFIILCLIPGLGIILALIGFVTYIVIMQSIGLNNLFGEDEFTIKFWDKYLQENLTIVRFDILCT